MARRLATVFGGSGFIGRHVVQRLAAAGYVVRVAVRDPIAAEFLKPMGDVGQIIPVRANVTDPTLVAAAVSGAETVINLVGILFETGCCKFDTIHVTGAANVAAAAKAAGTRTLVHISALGADKASDSAYARSKAAGEEAVAANFPGAAIVRPSVVFGPEDDFFNRFANLARLSPVLPVYTADGFRPERTENGLYTVNLFGSGGATFQPVYVGDVAEAIVKLAQQPALGGKVYELGGPRRYSLKEIMELVVQATGRCRFLVPLPFAVARLRAFFLQMMPKPLLTSDQVKLLKVDNVVRGGKPGLPELGIVATAAEAILPTYLSRHRKQAF